MAIARLAPSLIGPAATAQGSATEQRESLCQIANDVRRPPYHNADAAQVLRAALRDHEFLVVRGGLAGGGEVDKQDFRKAGCRLSRGNRRFLLGLESW